MKKHKIEVWMHKKTGNLVEHVTGSWIGNIIFYGMMIGMLCVEPGDPIIFDDDPRYKPDEYENLGKL